ncbi:T9SS type A sorting domain-containing protein [Siphonobacter sp. SORGH_AS_1065]|uniref:T9SS type A sorting domain-containing protein n=1 Tax=Siphonobacter sp. SORGH_AS_1065 TaxID=3041795 RepID=UPI00278480EE|nr:T9SS type A sorting domain-containing protein [Siphonobacter sp. SORGH_AS_1065]MDQ1086895.1 hypothetical protein [Siphonobacter sp. SORGH_AS_1065]
MKYLYSFLLLCGVNLTYAQVTTYFEQDFSSSSNTADYKGGGPNKFTELVANGSSTIDLSSQKLTLNKAAGSQIRFSKTDDLFTQTPTILYIQFTISANITETSNATTLYNYLYVGNLNDNGSLPANASVFARLGFHFNTLGNSFQLHVQEGGSVNKGPYSGTKTVTWIMNVSNASTSYNDDEGRVGTLEANKMDIWVDNSLEFDEASELSTGVMPTDFKFIWNNSNGTVTFDNLKIKGSMGPMPVELVYFKVTPVGTKVRMNWATSQEKNAKSFVVERSKDAEFFEVIGTYEASGTTTQRNEYSAVDEDPLSGTSYYRLRQIDEDGTQYICRTVSVVRNRPTFEWQVMGNPAVSAKAIYVQAIQQMSYELFSKSGQPVPLKVDQLTSEQTLLSPMAMLESGMYVLRASVGNQTSSQRIIIP